MTTSGPNYLIIHLGSVYHVTELYDELHLSAMELMESKRYPCYQCDREVELYPTGSLVATVWSVRYLYVYDTHMLVL